MTTELNRTTAHRLPPGPIARPAELAVHIDGYLRDPEIGWLEIEISPTGCAVVSNGVIDTAEPTPALSALVAALVRPSGT